MVVTRSQIRNRKVDHRKKQPNKKKKVSVVRRCSSSSSREEEVKGNNEFNKLSANVIASIFLRCPEKTLSMLRCTAKSWNDFIMNPSFLHSHLTQSMQNGPLRLYLYRHTLFRSGRSKLQFVSVDMEGNDEDLFTVIAPDAKLTCITWKVCAGLAYLATDRRIYLCNPLLHQLRELPNCSPSAIQGYNHFGIAYLPSMKEYKVVHFFYKGPPTRRSDLQLAQLRFEVCTLNREVSCSNNNNRWKGTAEVPPCHPISSGLLVNECMYWCAHVGRAGGIGDRILSFDFENETFLTISLPSCFENLYASSMIDLKGMLCLSDTVGFVRNTSILDLWMLKDKISGTWVKEYSINLENFRPVKHLAPSFKSWNEEIFFTHSDSVIVYDLKRKCFRREKRLEFDNFRTYLKSLFILLSFLLFGCVKGTSKYLCYWIKYLCS